MNKQNKQLMFSEEEKKYLLLLSRTFPTAQAASTEIINLEAIMTLPKGTEHFLTDIHGEYEMFSHILRNASGVVKRKIDEIFGKTITEQEKNQLATLIYYPEEKLEQLEDATTAEWYYLNLLRLIQVARVAAKKYTRSKVRKAMPADFAYIIDELINETDYKKAEYVDSILQSIIEIDRASHFVIAICSFIQRLLIDHLHIVGDIYDRGPNAAKVMDLISNYHSFDIQWGNHDLIWIGAGCGIDSLITEVIRFSARYDNLDTIEDAYGINLMPLLAFAMKYYGNDPCKCFIPKISSKGADTDTRIASLMAKAISIIGWKLEGQIIKRNPEFNMNHRLILDTIDVKNKTMIVEGKVCPINDDFFPTIDWNDPYKLHDDEIELMDKLRFSFLNCEKLQQHVGVLINKGSMYQRFNGNLLFHGCVPMKNEKEFQEFKINDEVVKGKALCDKFDRVVRRAWVNRHQSNPYQKDEDYCWYLWCGPCSPLFGKAKMATIERYLSTDEELYKEPGNPYFKSRDNEETCKIILAEFGLSTETSHIVNGHMPVKVIKGEKPVKANGKLIVIDGGMAKAYRKETGISGYTLIFTADSLVLVEHQPFESRTKAIEEEKDIISSRHIIVVSPTPICVGDTDNGVKLKEQVKDLKRLLLAYQLGVIKEK